MSCCKWPWETGQSSACGLSDLLNVPACPGTLPPNSILVGLPTSITTCDQVMDIIAQRLSKRICAPVVLTMSSTITYSLAVKLSTSSEATVGLSPASNCTYPITATYSKDQATGEAMFGSIESLLVWLTTILKV